MQWVQFSSGHFKTISCMIRQSKSLMQGAFALLPWTHSKQKIEQKNNESNVD